MAILRSKQIRSLSKEDVQKKIAELKLELMKETKPGQGASIKTKEIKKTIARLLTHARKVVLSGMAETKKVSNHAHQNKQTK